MRTGKISASVLALATTMLVGVGKAEVPQEAADALMTGDDAPLTPNGAIRAGNADGTIPAWEPIQTPPAGYNPTDGSWPYADPFADEKPLLTITAQNYQQYQDKLSAGQIAMLTRYPDTYRMHVYPSHRSWADPEWVYGETFRNASTVEITDLGQNPKTVTRGTCFPIANSGAEMRLNAEMLRCRYGTTGLYRYGNTAVVDASGDWQNTHLEEWVSSPHNDRAQSLDGIEHVAKFFSVSRAPARMAGTVSLFFYPNNFETAEFLAWRYNPGQRRVQRAPQLKYDYPKQGSNGLMTLDEAACEGFSDIDRYSWTVVGRKEMYVPYNSYKLADRELKEAQIFHKNHLNQDLARYELHRVWKVVGEQKPQYHMAIDKRVLHLDEDSWIDLVTDRYDSFGNLWRFGECHPMNYYKYPVFSTVDEVNYDLSSRAYVVVGVDQESPYPGKEFDQRVPDRTFSVGNMKGSGVR